jgi:pyruvate kinase
MMLVYDVIQGEAKGHIFIYVGINLPESNIKAPAITAKDWQCVDWAIEQRLDYVALSFVRHASDVYELKAKLNAHRRNDNSSHMHVISKIEKPQVIQSVKGIGFSCRLIG